MKRIKIEEETRVSEDVASVRERERERERERKNEREKEREREKKNHNTSFTQHTTH